MINTNGKFILHSVVLLILQLAVMNYIQINSYVHINIYVMILLLCRPSWYKTHILFLGFFLGLFMDYQNNTMGIHAASMTLTAYILPCLKKFSHRKSQEEDYSTRNFVKQALISILIFNTMLMFTEAMSFRNWQFTLLRIVYSTLSTFFFMVVYYFIALAKRHKTI